MTSGALFVVTSLVSSGSQKKVYSDSEFRCGDVGKVETFIGAVISFDSSGSGFQKKESSEMGFMYGVTGDETSFMGDENQSDFTC